MASGVVTCTMYKPDFSAVALKSGCAGEGLSLGESHAASGIA